jgi:hypothetical protein
MLLEYDLRKISKTVFLVKKGKTNRQQPLGTEAFVRPGKV